jgi:hypothetical protein
MFWRELKLGDGQLELEEGQQGTVPSLAGEGQLSPALHWTVLR